MLVCLGTIGQFAETRDVLRRAYDMAGRQPAPPFSIVRMHLELREIDAAFDCLDRAVGECDQSLMPMERYAFLDSILADPRLAALLRKMNLEP